MRPAPPVLTPYRARTYGYLCEQVFNHAPVRTMRPISGTCPRFNTTYLASARGSVKDSSLQQPIGLFSSLKLCPCQGLVWVAFLIRLVSHLTGPFPTRQALQLISTVVFFRTRVMNSGFQNPSIRQTAGIEPNAS